MKRIKLTLIKVLLLVPFALFSLLYITGVIWVLNDDRRVEPLDRVSNSEKTIAIFGASGTAGDGILKAAIESPDISKILVITRRVTPRMKAGVESGKVELTIHKDYLNYDAVINLFSQVDAVYWAIGINSIGVDEKTYGMIHVDFPMAFVSAWSQVSLKNSISFHYISSSDISESSTAMWAREKFRAEKSLFGFAQNSNMRVVAYRPDYIGPTREESHIGQEILFGFFSPVGVAVRAEQIGQAMIEVSARGQKFENGDKLNNSRIIRYSDAYKKRVSRDSPN